MRNFISVDDLKMVEAGLNLVIRGIDIHLRNDQPEPDLILDSLMLIDFKLDDMIKAAETET